MFTYFLSVQATRTLLF